jgi:ABC-type antimicrobial peptide transport system permease subunit
MTRPSCTADTPWLSIYPQWPAFAPLWLLPETTAQPWGGPLPRHEDRPLGSIFAFPGWIGVTVLAFTVGVTIVAALYPSRRAAKLDPVLALRHD